MCLFVFSLSKCRYDYGVCYNAMFGLILLNGKCFRKVNCILLTKKHSIKGKKCRILITWIC